MPPYTTTYTYFGQDHDYRLATAKVVGSEGTVEDLYDYKIGGGVTGHIHVVNSVPLFKTFSYDNYNRLLITAFESGTISYGSTSYTCVGSDFYTKNHYDVNGFLTKITTRAGGLTTDKILYEATGMNGDEDVKSFSRVDGRNAVIEYTDGFPTRYHTTGAQDLRMTYDIRNGNVSGREDFFAVPTNPKEFFTYDAIDRLKKAEASITGFAGTIYHLPQEIKYDELVMGTLSKGQIVSKSDVGSKYVYSGLPINAVKEIIVNTPGIISHAEQNIEYNEFNKAKKITEPIGGVDFEEKFVYDADEDRAYSQQSQGVAPALSVTRKRWYMGDYEMQETGGATQFIHYISGDAGLCGIVVFEVSSFNYYAAYTDHLGSIVKVTDESGATIADQNYDAWGRERHPGSWDYTSSSIPKPNWLYRGYTGHEMLPEYGLINMNGRMYDPANGRMLRPDNYVQDPTNTQSFNRYSYCWNNPLKYTDPSGDFITWGLNSSGISLGFNLTPVGIGWGAGINLSATSVGGICRGWIQNGWHWSWV